MRRFSERARIASVLRVVLVSCIALGGFASVAGCEELDARNRTKKGNRLFRETQFIDAAAEYQKALREVDDPVIHYNLGLAYSKVFKPGYEKPVLLGIKDDFVCQQIPGTRVVQAGACVKEGDRHYAECGKAKTAPIEKDIADLKALIDQASDDARKKELKYQVDDREQELGTYTCPPSFQCIEGPFCALSSPEIADLGAKHFQVWIKAQPSDDEIKKEIGAVSKELEAAKAADNNAALTAAQTTLESLETKDQTRKQMTLLWTDSDQYAKALAYWEGMLKDKQNDPEIMGVLAGINLKAGDWRRSIEWYNKVAEVTTDPSSKVAQYQFIGNVAWQKLNQRTLIGAEAIELADRGIGALQQAAELQPKNPRPIGLAASIFNFRSTAHGASFAAAIDRSNAQTFSALARALSEEAKKAQGQPAGAPAAQTPGTPGAGSAAPAGAGSGSSAGSGASGSATSSSTQPAAPAPAEGATTSPDKSATPPAAPAAPAPGGRAEKSGG